MKIQELILPFLLAVATWWGINHFFFSKKSVDQYRFSAPETAVACQPINKDITFTQTKKEAPTITPITTQWGDLEFSTRGATLTRLSLKRKMNGDERVLTTIHPQESLADQAFVVGLSADTPYNFKLIDQAETPDAFVLTYQGQSEQGVIRKTFSINRTIHKVDLELTLIPKKETIQARIFVPAPFMPQLKEENNIAADSIDRSDVYTKTFKDYVRADEGMIKPDVFGVENKYFLHAMVADPDEFVQRAFYKLGDSYGLNAIMESGEIKNQTSFRLSFYMGPKELSAIEQVDPRLEQAMDYSGWWAPISRILLKILNWLYSYLHNYGLAIIVLTILIRLLLVPFSIKAERGAKDRAEMQKRLQYIQQKHKNDPEARAQAQAEFMQKHGLGLGGCLPMLLQLPIFFGLSRLLSSAIELYQAPFLWIPDLSAADPYYVLPALVTIGLMATGLTSSDTKQRMPMVAMGLTFGAFSASLSSGLVLYIAFGSILNLAQTQILKWLKWT